MTPPVRGLSAVIHVVAKDFRRHRLPLAGYGGAVVLAAAYAASGGDLPALAPVAVILLGLILAVLLVHDDPPFRSHAFWALHPVPAGAVYGAKLLEIFGLILGMALLGQCVILLGYGVAPVDLPRLLLSSVPIAASFLLAGLLLATSFRTVAGIAAAVAVGFVALPLMSAAFFMLLMAGIPISRLPLDSVYVWGGAVVAGLVWAGLRYTAPANFPAGRVIGAFIALVVVAGGLSRAPTDRPGSGLPHLDPDELVAAHPALEDVTIELLSAGGQGIGTDGPQVNVRARVRAPESEAGYRLRPESVRLLLPDGTMQDLELGPATRELPGIPPGAAGRWIGPPPTIHRDSEVRLRPDPAQWEILRAGDSKVELTVVVKRLESREVGAMAFRAGASMTSTGTRIRHGGPGTRGPDSAVIHEITVGPLAMGQSPAMWSSAPSGAALGYALLSREAEEGVVLHPRGGSGHGLGLYPGAGLLLPGPAAREWRGEWTLPPAALEEVDAEWLDQARLHAFRWSVVGTDRVVSAPVELTVQGPPPTGRPQMPMHPGTP